MTYRNIQGLRAIAALLVVSAHMFFDIEPMRTHWAKPFFGVVGGAGVDLFFAISGFLIYQVMRRSIASMDSVGRARAAYGFAMKRFIRVYPLFWLVFGTSCAIMAWLSPTPPAWPEPLFRLLALIGNVPNPRVYVAWTLSFEVYFYAVAALSLVLFARRAMAGVLVWFAVIGTATLIGFRVPWGKPLDFVFSPLLLEFLPGMAVAFLLDRGFQRFHGALLAGAFTWMAAGAHFLTPSLFVSSEARWGLLAAVHLSFALHVVCWGLPAAILVYGLVVLEIRRRWIMPRVLQYLGDASFSIYLWHAVAFHVAAEAFAHLGWVGVTSSTGLTALMVAIGLGISLLGHHGVERPLLRLLGQWLLGRGVSFRSLEAAIPAGPAAQAAASLSTTSR